jgi:predicted O-methyltransferase YrrM
MSLSRFKKSVDKALLLISILPKHPLEFYDRVLTLLEVQLERLWVRPFPYEIKEYQEVILEMEKLTSKEMTRYLNELNALRFEEKVRSQADEITPCAPFRLSHSADFTLARMCYAMVRAIKPNVVLETGVAYGVTSAFILKAMEVNNNGLLHSVDLPPLGYEADRFVGILIPDNLKHRWNLHRGVSKRVLPRLLQQVGQVDVFIHDSLHTNQNMRYELSAIMPYLAKPSVVIADDIDGNSAFLEWSESFGPAYWAAMQEVDKKAVFGLGLFV